MAGGDAPGLLHPLGVDANDGADFAPGGGDLDVAQHARPPAGADPIRRLPRLAAGGGHLDVAAKTNGVVEAEALQKREQLDVAEASIGQDRHGDALGQALLQTGEAGVFEIVARILQFVLVDGEPDQRRGPPVAGDQMQAPMSSDCRRRNRSSPSPPRSCRALPTMCSTHGVNRSQTLTPRLLSSRSTCLIACLSVYAARLRQAMTDHGHGERGAGRHTERAIGKRQHALRVQILAKHTRHKFLNGLNTIDRSVHSCPTRLIRKPAPRRLLKSGVPESH